MLYYLAAKIIRNRINHANIDVEEEQELIDEMKHYEVDIDIKPERIKEILFNGVRLLQ